MTAPTATTPTGPLSDIRVVELGSFIAGPIAASCSPTWAPTS